jgi:hypothetical protein
MPDHSKRLRQRFKKPNTISLIIDSTNMQMLDLDLDFFLNGIAYSGINTGRQPSNDFTPWSERRVRRFLEGRLGLSSDNPIDGRVVTNHDQAFDFWGQLIQSGKLSTPFDICHVDSHSDLGSGISGFVYLMTEFIKINPEDRYFKVNREQIGCGDYLAFAIACRWISGLRWIYHPQRHDDLPWWHFKTIKPRSGIVQLRRMAWTEFDQQFVDKHSDYDTLPVELEPQVQFKMQSWRHFKARGTFNYFVVSQSPGFTPFESDRLIPIIQEYIHQI